MNKIWSLILGLFSGFIFLAIDQPMLLIISVFIFVFSFQSGFQKFLNVININLILKIVFIMLIVGFLTEFFAIWNNVDLTDEEIVNRNKLYSVNPVEDILIGFGYYIPLGVIWYFLLKKYKYNTWDLFLTMGIYGIVFEGGGLILLSFNPLIWFYAFIVHGSYMAIMHLIVKKDPIFQKSKRISSFKKVVLGFLCSLLTVIPFAIFKGIVSLFF